MKKCSFVLALLAAIVSFGCSDDDNNFYPEYSHMPVSVITDQYTGVTKFVTDFDAVLIPDNLSQLSSSVKKCKRLAVSFATNPRKQKLESDNTYNVTLGTDSYSNIVIPTFPNVDLFSNPTAQDSIASKCKVVQSVNSETAYVANGFLNANVTFLYELRKPVVFALYFDGELGVDVSNKTVSCGIYFNPGDGVLTEPITSAVCFELPSDLYYTLTTVGHFSDDEEVTLNVEVKTADGSKIKPIKFKLADLLSYPIK